MKHSGERYRAISFTKGCSSLVTSNSRLFHANTTEQGLYLQSKLMIDFHLRKIQNCSKNCLKQAPKSVMTDEVEEVDYFCIKVEKPKGKPSVESKILYRTKKDTLWRQNGIT